MGVVRPSYREERRDREYKSRDGVEPRLEMGEAGRKIDRGQVLLIAGSTVS